VDIVLHKELFRPWLQKIAVAALSLSQGSRSRSRSRTNLGSSDISRLEGNRRSLNPQSTLNKARDNADLQPLNKKIRKPADMPHAIGMTKKNIHLSHLEDKRINKHHLRFR